ncbi:MAG: LysR family transcriptional regulator [Ectothiorhodospiraceae bacterium]|nr:LysR family transcriptional regulator [Ectothiorhodospiraceae bacterium]MCH8504037.1 LysR family transcriptional regulator [Ectothiorhodospiraceae bacterium]
MDRFTALRVFKRVVELNGFTAAARDLGLSNAAVSKNVNALEAFLGARLLTRTTRRMSLTEAGEAYYRRCVRILEDLEEADAMVTSMAASPRGVLRVTAPMSLGLIRLSGVIPRFLARYPEVKIDLNLDDRVVDLIDGGYDIALGTRSTLQDSSLVSRRLGTLPRVVCATPEYLEQHGRPEQPQDLAHHRCLLFSLMPSPNEWSFQRQGLKETVHVDGPYSVNSSLTIREALLQSVGITLIPKAYVEDALASGKLVTVLDDWQPSEQSVYAIFPSARYLSPKVRAFIDFLVERFSGE